MPGDRECGRRAFLERSARLGIELATLAAGVSAAVTIGRRPPPGTFGVPVQPGGALREALHWRRSCGGVQCTLCPYECFLPEGARGRCKVRVNRAGRLMTLVHSSPVAVHVDPIEKKPVYHLLPGSRAFSIATVGCSLSCVFCQNWEISQSFPETARGEPLPPEAVVEEARRAGCDSIAYTYSEPAVYYEYVLETARLARRAGLHNVLVSCGYINVEPLKDLAPLFSVIKIDLKGFNEGFYRRIVGGELRFVKRTLEVLAGLKVLIEVVNLVIPTLNDDPGEIRQMCAWIRDSLGADTPVFFSRFTPQYRMQNLPPTPLEVLENAYRIARSERLNFVYLGNVPRHPTESTFCPGCGTVLVERLGYRVGRVKVRAGRCPDCGRGIPGIWSKKS